MAIKEIKKEQILLAGEVNDVLQRVDKLMKDNWIIVSQSISSDALPNGYHIRQQYLSVLLELEIK